MTKGRYNSIDPVAYGAAIACPNATTGVVSCLKGDNSDLLREVAKLWIKFEDRIVDVTYGNGTFWKQLPDLVIEKYDLETGTDCRDLPIENNSVDVLVFDPPYQPTHGSPSKSFGVGNTYRLRVTQLQTINDVLSLYQDGIREAWRVIRPQGRILIKCQDMSYNHSLHLVHLDIIRAMVSVGFDLVDMFVLLNQSRMPQTTKRQQRAHRSHSYLVVGYRS